MNTDWIKRNSLKSYMMELLLRIGLSMIVSIILLLFIASNLYAFCAYLVRMGTEAKLVQAFANGSLISVLFYVFLGMLIFSMVFLYMERRNARNVERIAEAVEQISEGNLETELNIEGEGEISRIASSIMKMEKEIGELLERERAGEKSKTDLITNVAHDLRTPLTSILGYLELLSRGDVNEETRKKYIDIAYNKAKRLQSLIEELFGFTKLSYGQQNMTITKFDIVKLLGQIMEESYPSFEKNSLSYEFTSDIEELSMEGDANLVARIFDNIITNAIKYGAEGKQVVAKLTHDETQVRIAIINFGRQIPEEELPMVFDKFYRVEHSRSQNTGGTGLGLAIVKNITEMHHGTVSVESDREGTRFIVQLPLHYEEEQEMFIAGDIAWEEVQIESIS